MRGADTMLGVHIQISTCFVCTRQSASYAGSRTMEDTCEALFARACDDAADKKCPIRSKGKLVMQAIDAISIVDTRITNVSHW